MKRRYCHNCCEIVTGNPIKRFCCRACTQRACDDRYRGTAGNEFWLALATGEMPRRLQRQYEERKAEARNMRLQGAA